MTAPDSQPDSRASAVPRQYGGLLLVGALMLGIYLVSYRPDIPTVACNADTLAGQPDVIMFGAWWCPYCAEARRYFHDNNVHYCEFDIERDDEGRRRYEEVGGRGVPVLIFGERYRVNGFDAALVERALTVLDDDRRGDARPD
jgi:glutaredoxin